MNLAPVVDVAPEGFDSIMRGRMFGSDPAHVGRMGAAVIEGLQSRGIMAVAKHFPGIGRTTLDSHLDLPVFDADPASLEAFDLDPVPPADRGAGGGDHAVRTSSTRPSTPSGRPASRGRSWPGLLRSRMGYDGVVITDDLEMGAVSRHYGFAESRAAGAAGGDRPGADLPQRGAGGGGPRPHGAPHRRHRKRSAAVTRVRIEASCGSCALKAAVLRMDVRAVLT